MRKRRTWLLLMGGLLFSALCVIAVGVLLLVDVRGSLSLPEMLYLRVWLAGYEADLARPAGSDATPVIFRVEPGDNAAAIGAKLAAQGLITDADLFRNYARYHGLDTQFEAGTYFLRATQTLPDIALTLTDSSRASVTIQVIDGWRREEIAASIDANPLLSFSGQDFLAATGPGATLPAGFADYVDLPAGASLEGFLFPDTYFLPPDVDAATVRDTLLQTFVERVPPTLKQAAASAGLSLTDVVTLASIVTREAVHADEQPLIASVYLNRLAIGMKLDADPTVQYGIGYRDGAWWPSDHHRGLHHDRLAVQHLPVPRSATGADRQPLPIGHRGRDLSGHLRLLLFPGKLRRGWLPRLCPHLRGTRRQRRLRLLKSKWALAGSAHDKSTGSLIYSASVS